MERERRRVAAGVILAAAVAVATGLSAAQRGATELPERVSEAAAVRLGLPTDGRAVLLVAGDRSCAACRQAFEDLERPNAREIPGLHVALRSREELGAAGLSLPPGPVPVYLLVEGDGRMLAVTRGYLPPVSLDRWLRAVFAAP